jgi:hypothetical protein
MEQPEPAEGWPDRPVAEAEASDLLTEHGAIAIWVMDHESSVHGAVAPGTDEGDVVDIVIETDEAFEMYSFSRGQWMDYGTQRKDDEEAPSMAGTLESYRVLAGASGSF